MKSVLLYISVFVLIAMISCNDNDFRDAKVQIPEFNFPKTIVFEQKLSSYQVFEGKISDLIPSKDFHLLELSSELFSDYAHKQRLVKVPQGTQMERLENGSIEFPNGSILTKTFFYYVDERDTSLGKRIIETRLLIKESETWNVATYVWNEDQNEAELKLDGMNTNVTWVSLSGNSLSTNYHIPTENECMTCHQSNSSMSPLGPTLRNLNRDVERKGSNVNLIHHLQSISILNDFTLDERVQIADYKKVNESLSERGRAYLAMNCAHCHNPSAWSTPAEKDLDFRYNTPLSNTGIISEKDRISRVMADGEMPFIGTTIIDREGVDLITQYLESL